MLTIQLFIYSIQNTFFIISAHPGKMMRDAIKSAAPAITIDSIIGISLLSFFTRFFTTFSFSLA